MAAAHGSHKRTAEGIELIDYTSGHAALIFGHSPDYAVELRDRCNRNDSHLGSCHEAEVEWAESVCRMIPSAEMVRFTVTGTEATMLALRLARAATGRNEIIRLAGHYHGWHDTALVGYLPPHDRTSWSGVSPSVAKDIHVVAHDDLATISEVLSSGRIAALILEPNGPTAGTVPTDGAYLSRIRELTAAAGTVLIFDEVITGFRWAPGGAQEYWGVTPDLTTLGKILGGGMPAGAVAGSRPIMELMSFRSDADWNRDRRVFQNGTWNAFTHSAVVGSATLARLHDGKAQDAAAATAAVLRAGLQRKLEASGLSGCVYGERSGVRFLLDDPGSLPSADPDAFLRLVPSARLLAHTPPRIRTAFWKASLLEGVDWIGGDHGWVSTAHTEQDVEETVEAFGRALQRVVVSLGGSTAEATS
jgi:glutamate-1-semialdehyde 2,1-aminomutase